LRVRSFIQFSEYRSDLGSCRLRALYPTYGFSWVWKLWQIYLKNYFGKAEKYFFSWNIHPRLLVNQNSAASLCIFSVRKSLRRPRFWNSIFLSTFKKKKPPHFFVSFLMGIICNVKWNTYDIKWHLCVWFRIRKKIICNNMQHIKNYVEFCIFLAAILDLCRHFGSESKIYSMSWCS
jgi:hypothetical protein